MGYMYLVHVMTAHEPKQSYMLRTLLRTKIDPFRRPALLAVVSEQSSHYILSYLKVF